MALKYQQDGVEKTIATIEDDLSNIEVDGNALGTYFEVSLLETLESTNAEANGFFGISVSMTDNYAIVGAYGEDAQSLSSSGRVYIFENNAGSWNTTPV